MIPKVSINSDYNDTESIKSILIEQKTYSYEKIAIKFIFNICSYMFIVLCMFPFAFLDLYFANKDESCVNLEAGKLLINLGTILNVDGIVHIMLFIIMPFVLYTLNNFHTLENKYNVPYIILKLMSIFDISWTILGSIIFWGLIDNNKCDTIIYNYIYAKFIIMFIIKLLIIIS